MAGETEKYWLPSPYTHARKPKSTCHMSNVTNWPSKTPPVSNCTTQLKQHIPRSHFTIQLRIKVLHRTSQSNFPTLPSNSTTQLQIQVRPDAASQLHRHIRLRGPAGSVRITLNVFGDVAEKLRQAANGGPASPQHGRRCRLSGLVPKNGGECTGSPGVPSVSPVPLRSPLPLHVRAVCAPYVCGRVCMLCMQVGLVHQEARD